MRWLAGVDAGWRGHIRVMTVSVSLPVAVRNHDARPWTRRIMCAMNDNGTALCDHESSLEQVTDITWADVPVSRRCRRCHLLLDA